SPLGGADDFEGRVAPDSALSSATWAAATSPRRRWVQLSNSNPWSPPTLRATAASCRRTIPHAGAVLIGHRALGKLCPGGRAEADSWRSHEEDFGEPGVGHPSRPAHSAGTVPRSTQDSQDAPRLGSSSWRRTR